MSEKRAPLLHVVFPLVAVILQVLAVGSLWVVAEMSYAVPRTCPEWIERPAGLVVLGLAGLAAGGFALVGLYRIHRRANLWIALPVTIVVYLPILLVAVVCSFVFFVFFGWV